MNIYVATSWRNKYQPDVVKALRAKGHEVYDFRHPNDNSEGFHWSDIDPNWQQWTKEQYKEALNHPIAMQGFGRDMAALEKAEAVVMVLPCGRSAHLELGYAIGRHNLGIIYIPEAIEPELMYKMGAQICTTMDEVIGYLDGWKIDPLS
jgi:hypothetical protein